MTSSALIDLMKKQSTREFMELLKHEQRKRQDDQKKNELSLRAAIQERIRDAKQRKLEKATGGTTAASLQRIKNLEKFSKTVKIKTVVPTEDEHGSFSSEVVVRLQKQSTMK